MPKLFNYCFQQAAGGVHKLYIYDDVKAYSRFNWETWKYEESETSAKYFREKLEQIPDTDTIELHINSNGGSVKEGVAIYNQLKQKKCKKVGYVDGVAYSVAFVILQACDERIMGIGTSALIHEIWIETCGNAKELRKMADDLDVLMESNRKIFLERSNLTEQQLIEMMEAETFLTPEQCLEYALIDEVGTYRAEEPDPQNNIEEQVQQMKKLLEEKRIFRNELEKLQSLKKEEPEQKKTMNKLAGFFGKM